MKFFSLKIEINWFLLEKKVPRNQAIAFAKYYSLHDRMFDPVLHYTHGFYRDFWKFFQIFSSDGADSPFQTYRKRTHTHTHRKVDSFLDV